MTIIAVEVSIHADGQRMGMNNYYLKWFKIILLFICYNGYVIAGVTFVYQVFAPLGNQEDKKRARVVKLSLTIMIFFYKMIIFIW